MHFIEISNIFKSEKKRYKVTAVLKLLVVFALLGFFLSNKPMYHVQTDFYLKRMGFVFLACFWMVFVTVCDIRLSQKVDRAFVIILGVIAPVMGWILSEFLINEAECAFPPTQFYQKEPLWIVLSLAMIILVDLLIIFLTNSIRVGSVIVPFVLFIFAVVVCVVYEFRGIPMMAPDILTVQIKGNGPIGAMTVTADPKGNVKGFVGNPEVMLPLKDGKLDIAGAVGIGVLSVIKDIGLKEPYVGDTILITSEIADDLTYYYATSEQVPSSVGLGVLMTKENTVEQAGGFIIQLMPDATEEVIDKLEKRIKEVKSVTEMLENGMTPEKILEHILGDMELEILDTVQTQFHCNCSKERVSKAVMSIGAKDLKEMVDDNKPIEVNCHFCNSHYTFSPEELEQMLEAVTK